MLFDPNPGETVEKLMTITPAEFRTGVERLTGAPPVQVSDTTYDLSAASGGHALLCSLTAQPDAVLGGLMRLQRFLVTLDLRGVPAGERSAIVARFDQVFQRGGG